MVSVSPEFLCNKVVIEALFWVRRSEKRVAVRMERQCLCVGRDVLAVTTVCTASSH